ncbi:hypothetical protein IF1G_09727 [Cordyceps javanica]|uniref:Uncharacterized protein n=1 Tax=Cordyceps javanica TaxID=43265 RepID=A0A545UQC0_9HYPO|nr:hypothetical protein IF1G_09727 [Cordyceps javanica]
MHDLSRCCRWEEDSAAHHIDELRLACELCTLQSAFHSRCSRRKLKRRKVGLRARACFFFFPLRIHVLLRYLFPSFRLDSDTSLAHDKCSLNMLRARFSTRHILETTGCSAGARLECRSSAAHPASSFVFLGCCLTQGYQPPGLLLA